MIAGISVRHSAASTGPTSPPTPPVRATPPSTAAATLFSVKRWPMRARGSPPPVDAVVDDAGEAGEETADGVGEDARAGDVDPGQERRLAVAADGVDRRGPSRLSRSGSQTRTSTPTVHSTEGQKLAKLPATSAGSRATCRRRDRR